MAYLTALTTIAIMEALSIGDLMRYRIAWPARLPGHHAVYGPGGTNRLAQIIAATCMAGETSTVAAIVSDEFINAMRYSAGTGGVELSG